jgi:flagellar motor switch/type III secretory pathway protein FliN
MSRREARVQSAVARWVGPRRLGAKLAALVGGPVRGRLLGIAPEIDPHAAVVLVRHGGASIAVTGSSRPVRALAQRLLRGPAELEAPRPLTVVEQAIWALAVAAALADLDAAGEVWPLEAARPVVPGAIRIAFAVELPAWLGGAMTVTADLPPELVIARPARPLPGFRLALPVVVGRCALPRASAGRLAVRDVITIEPRLELEVGAGAIGLSAVPGAVEARVATEYVPRDMTVVDDATLEVTVQLGTTRLSLRELGELAVGQVVPLGRPLAGPYEVRAAGRVLGQGELVDIDGELGVRIVAIADPSDGEPDR